MDHSEPAVWTDADRALWARIAAHDFEPSGHDLTFTGRLAREHGWSLDVARGAVEEYRRFCFLALHAESEVTPSEEVDEVWHQHLTFSQDYWQVWCADVLRTNLHHRPTRGGPSEGRRFAEQYARTLARYEAWFGPPPRALWPGTAERFGHRPSFRIVDVRRVIVLPRPRVGVWNRFILPPWLAAIAAMWWPGPAAAASLDALDWTAGPFLTFYVAAAAISLVAAHRLPLLLTSVSARVARRSRLTPVELAFLAGGRSRAADTMALQAMAAGRLIVTGRNLVIDGMALDRASFQRERSEALDSVRDHLADQGLALPARRMRLVQTATFGLVAPVLALGLGKIAVGQSRDKPVGLLTVLLLVTAFAALVMAIARNPASREGRQRVATSRIENPRALRAPMTEEVIWAFSIVGIGALTGTAFEAYAVLLKPSGDGGGCDGGSGCGSGGGGCGGCGGD